MVPPNPNWPWPLKLASSIVVVGFTAAAVWAGAEAVQPLAGIGIHAIPQGYRSVTIAVLIPSGVVGLYLLAWQVNRRALRREYEATKTIHIESPPKPVSKGVR